MSNIYSQQITPNINTRTTKIPRQTIFYPPQKIQLRTMKQERDSTKLIEGTKQQMVGKARSLVESKILKMSII